MKTVYANAVREAKSREELISLGNNSINEYGMYSLIKDRRGTSSVSRYLDRGEQLPSVEWTTAFVQAGGNFDSCGSWGVTPARGVELENLGVPAEFAGRMLALVGRADYDYQDVGQVFFGGFNPQKRAEFHASARGIRRQELAQSAKALEKSTIRLGWMGEQEFDKYIIKTSKKVSSATSYYCFNGINIPWDEGEFYYLKNDEFLKNHIFKKWVLSRPTETEKNNRDRRCQERDRPVGWLEIVPPRLMAAAIRGRREYIQGVGRFVSTSVGYFLDCGDGETLVFSSDHNRPKIAKTVLGHKIRPDLSVIKISGMYFVWDPRTGFQKHMENESLRVAIKLWENRSDRRGEQRPICLNDVRNDRYGTSGFCLAGTKAFLQNRMPFVYRLVESYTSWVQIPEDILSTKWEVDFKVFQGYPVP